MNIDLACAALENCLTEAELYDAIRNVEARHRVEGISPIDEASWENVKREHIKRIKRIYRTVAA